MSAAEKLSEHPLLPPGLHPGIPAAVYHTNHLGLVSKGALSAIGRSPKHYRAWLEKEDEDTPALAFGRAFHSAILEPEIFARDYIVAPDFGDCRYRENRAARDGWRTENVDKIAITAADMKAIAAMRDSIRGHELGRLMLRSGEPELTVTWQDQETRLFCKCRPDYYVRSLAMCIDVKTTGDARLDHFTRDAVMYDYPLQDALYRAGLVAVGEPCEHFLFLAVEKTPPFDVAVHELDRDGLMRGYARARTRMDRLAECLRTDAWPGYAPHIHTIELPPWYD